MIRAKHFKKVIITVRGVVIEYVDVVLIPSWLLKSILRYDDELLKEKYNSLTDYGKGVVDTVKKQQQILSINMDGEYVPSEYE